MNGYRTVFAAALMAVMSPGLASAGPFGLEKGQQIPPSIVVGDGKGPRISLKSVPKPHPLLKNYSVFSTPMAGVCGISAGSGRMSSLFVDGQKPLWDLDKISAQLVSLYGEYEPVANATLPNGHKVISARTWRGNPLNGIDTVVAYVEDAGLLGSFVIVEYKLDNFRECMAESSKIAAESDQEGVGAL